VFKKLLRAIATTRGQSSAKRQQHQQCQQRSSTNSISSYLQRQAVTFLPFPYAAYTSMLDLFNMPRLTDEGAKELGARAAESLAKCAPSQTTTLVVGGGLLLLGFGWLAFSFYKESRSGYVHHTVAHTPCPPPPPPPT
jgi:hypothetical protein